MKCSTAIPSAALVGRFRALRFGFYLFVVACCAGFAHAQCTNASLNGVYGFTITGQILAPPPAAGPVAGVARTYFDGQGHEYQTDHVVHNGVTPVEHWRPASGLYEVNSDCTGWFTIVPMPTDPVDGSPDLKLWFILVNGGKEIRTVVSGSPNVPAFVSTITSIGTLISSSAPDAP